MGYTVARARLYLAAHGRAKRRERRETLILMRGAQADQAGFERVWESLGD
jgi:hypothetical protein